jgi:LysM repeat protein
MSKKDHSNETFDERPDDDFLPFDETGNRSRMAKEAKIGLGVIFILLIVLGFVVYDRMMRPDEAPEATAEAGSSETDNEGTAAPEQPKPESPPIDWNRQTVMDAKSGSGAAKTAQSRKLDSRGLTVEDGQAPKAGAASTAAASPRSNMPRLVAPTPSDRYSNQRNTQAATQTTDSRQSYDRYAKAPAQGAAKDAEPGLAAVADTQADAGPRLPNTAIAPAPQPKLQQTPSWRQPTETPRLAKNTEAVRYPDRSAQVNQVAQSAGKTAGQIEAPSYRAGPHSSYRTPLELSAPTLKISTSEGKADPPSVAEMVPVQIAPAKITPTRASPAQVAPTEIAPAPTAVVQARPSDPTSPAIKPSLPSVSSRPQVLTKLDQQLTNPALPRKAGTCVVQPNDSYWAISQRLYGTGGYFQALAQHNRNTVPDANRLRVGEQIRAPDASELEKVYPDLCPKLAHRKAAERRMSLGSKRSAVGSGRVYVVQEGDNLFDIARYELGKPTRWTEIVNLNHELLGSDLEQLNYLTPGMRLVLPDRPAAKQAPVVARQPGSAYRR